MAQKTERADVNTQKTENQPFTKDLYRLKSAWERLQKIQNEIPVRFRKRQTDFQISSVKIVKGPSGQETVQISLLNGKKIMDIGDQRAVFQKMMPKKNINIGKILSLLSAVRKYGFAAVAMGLSPAMKDLLLKACKRCGIPLQVKEKKVVRNIVKQVNPKIAKPCPTNNQNQHDRSENKKLSPAITSSRSLEEVILQQKKENDAYLQYVLRRTDDRAREKYFNRLRVALVDIEQRQKNGVALTEDQVKIRKLAEQFGLKNNQNNESPTERQKNERRSLRLRDLPQDIQTELRNAKKRYRAIRSSKKKAADLVHAKHAKDFEKGVPLKLSATDLALEAASYLPPPDQRNIQNLKFSMEKIKNQTVQEKEELNKIKKEKQDRAAALMVKTMSAAAPKKTKLQQQIKSIEQPCTVHRKSFLSNAVMQELINRQQAER